jgi:hypothetical protein
MTLADSFSQHGRPVFLTEDGLFLFPAADEIVQQSGAAVMPADLTRLMTHPQLFLQAS